MDDFLIGPQIDEFFWNDEFYYSLIIDDEEIPEEHDDWNREFYLNK